MGGCRILGCDKGENKTNLTILTSTGGCHPSPATQVILAVHGFHPQLSHLDITGIHHHHHSTELQLGSAIMTFEKPTESLLKNQEYDPRITAIFNKKL